MHLPGVAEFFFGGGCGRGLNKFTEASARVGESPRGKFDAKGVQGLEDFVFVAVSDGAAHGSVTTETENASSFSPSPFNLAAAGGPNPVEGSTKWT
jgi:hypothetical protein